MIFIIYLLPFFSAIVGLLKHYVLSLGGNRKIENNKYLKLNSLACLFGTNFKGSVQSCKTAKTSLEGKL